MKVIVSHPTGNGNVRAVLTSFANNGLLTEFATTIAVAENAKWLKIIPAGLRKELLRRTFSIPPNRIRAHPLLELCRMILPKLRMNYFTQHELGWASIDSVYRNLDGWVAKELSHRKKNNSVTSVYAYEDGALATFTKAKELGLSCIYDLPIAYWETVRSLLQTEAERMSVWKNTLGGGVRDSQKKLERKTNEMKLADVIVCPGKFVADSIPAWAKQKPVIVSPFGSPEISSSFFKRKEKRANQPLRVLFVGSMGQRKGLGDLFAAMKLIKTNSVELVVMGSLLETMSFYREQLPQFIYEPGRPHSGVLELMRNCDVLCLPSVVEGRALVMQEAMSQGLPLIITPNTGGEDLIIEGKTGFLVPIGSPEAIAEKIDWFANNRSELEAMGEAARQHAAQYSWQQYGQHIIDELRFLLPQ